MSGPEGYVFGDVPRPWGLEDHAAPDWPCVCGPLLRVGEPIF